MTSLPDPSVWPGWLSPQALAYSQGDPLLRPNSSRPSPPQDRPPRLDCSTDSLLTGCLLASRLLIQCPLPLFLILYSRSRLSFNMK